ncbi:NucA/NucB deoxyribonuclease domain-containing protein [Streptomyces canus]|uniref:NucA/NucB deoxyribonuclease domain-containing protein n=1 Tax=Streptomyces canus TaxID=58343 RepID=UPI003F6AE1DA
MSAEAESAANSNRRATCEDGTFVPFDDDIVVDDSCDEFPFAGTYEGGTVGSFCADIVPLFEDGQWYIYEASADKPVTYHEPCVRGHVPLTYNSAAGGKYGSFVQTDRVLDTESFNVTVTD